MESTTFVPEVCRKKIKMKFLLLYMIYIHPVSLSKTCKNNNKKGCNWKLFGRVKKKSPYVIDNFKIHVLMI